MAKRFVLVPESFVRKLQTGPSDEDKKTEFMALADVLPKSLKNRARLLLSHLYGKVELSENNQVIYPDTGKSGSHLLDLARYFLTGKQFSSLRPVDTPQFAQLLLDLSTPKSSLAKSPEDELKTVRRKRKHTNI